MHMIILEFVYGCRCFFIVVLVIDSFGSGFPLLLCGSGLSLFGSGFPLLIALCGNYCFLLLLLCDARLVLQFS